MLILAFSVVFGCLVYGTTALCPVSSVTNPATGLCYWRHSTAMDAATCNTSCGQDGGIMGEVPNHKSQLFLMNYFQSNGASYSGIWVGINDIDAELHYFTWDGYPQAYFNWESGQPNGYPVGGPTATEQDCMLMIPADNYTWQDKPCGELHMCLCSYRSAPRSCSGGSATLTQEELDDAIKDLQVDKDSTNAAKRKLTSAKDDRPSAQAIGFVGVIIIAVTYSLPILMDFQRCCQKKKITTV